MEGGGRAHRGRGGSGRRGGGGGGNESGTFGEHRGGRGRGGHHRGRGKRDHYRGRGRGTPAADFNRAQDDNNDRAEFEDEGPNIYSRRKLETNWDRYEASEQLEQNEDVPVQRGTDYHALLGSAGDSFSQFRFAEEKDWEADSLASHQMSGVFLDLAVLTQALQELPLQQRLNLEPELVQEATPADLPAVSMVTKPDIGSGPLGSGGAFKVTPPVAKALGTAAAVAPGPVTPTAGADRAPEAPEGAQVPSSKEGKTQEEEEEADEELDLLLGLQKPVTELSISDPHPSSPEPIPSQNGAEEKKAEEGVEAAKKQEVPPKAVPVKQEVTEEDLEDWLDSMIS